MYSPWYGLCLGTLISVLTTMKTYIHNGLEITYIGHGNVEIHDPRYPSNPHITMSVVSLTKNWFAILGIHNRMLVSCYCTTGLSLYSHCVAAPCHNRRDY